MKEDTPPIELDQRFGKPAETVVLADGATAWVWDVDPEGDGVAVARSVASAAECVLIQVDQIMEYAARHELTIRQLVVATRLDGNRRFHERPDLMAVEAAIDVSPRWCKFVLFTDLHRISRASMGLLLFRGYLREKNVKLIVASIPNIDDLQLDVLSAIAAEERNEARKFVTRQRLRRHEYDKLVARGAATFGFARGLEVDLDEWEYVQFIFERIDKAPANEPIKKTLHLISNQLAEGGMPMSVRRLRKIITNRLYTGDRHIQVGGVARTLPEFDLPEPIPLEVFERVNKRLKTDDALE